MLSRHNIYYFRWPMPRPVRERGKATHVKISLDTRDPKEALRLSTMLQDHAYNLLRQDWVLNMDFSEIKAMVEAHFAKVLEDRKRDIDKNGALLPFPMAGAKRFIKGIDQSINGTAEYSVFADDDSDLAEIVREFELDLSKSEKDRKRLKMVYWQGAKAMMQEVIAYSESQEKFNFGTAQSQAAITRNISKPENRLERVMEKYTAEMAKAEAWGIRATEERISCFDYLKELVGADFDLPRFDVITARGVKEALQRTPVNRGKLKETRGLPLSEQIKLEGLPTLSPGSINKYLQCYGSFFTWAVANGYADKNPFAKMGMKDNGKKKRDLFKPEQVKVFLTEIDKGKSGLLDSDMKFWGLLIALYTGARLNEIASLTPNDVKQDKKTGIWFFDINDEEEKKRLKTNAATRLVPVHTEILKHGFLQYVDDVRKAGSADTRLLPKLAYSEKEGWGRKLGRWFNDVFLHKLEMKKPGTSFHSLRHTVITNLRRAGVDNHNVRALVGHEPDGVTEEVYMHDLGLPQLQKDIERLNYRQEEE